MMDVLTALQTIKETLNITKELRQIDDKVAVADLKLKLADVVDGLLSAKEALQDAREREGELLKEIENLRTSLTLKSKMEDDEGCLYELDDHGNRVAKPFCNKCFVKEERLYRLVSLSKGFGPGYTCDNCGFVTRN